MDVSPGLSPTVAPLSREAVVAIIEALTRITCAVEKLPYTVARPALSDIETIQDLLGECFPGGTIHWCEACGTPIGGDEIAATDNEGGGSYCAPCTAAYRADPDTVIAAEGIAPGDDPASQPEAD